MLRFSKTAKLPAVELFLNMEEVNGKNFVDLLHVQLMQLIIGIAG